MTLKPPFPTQVTSGLDAKNAFVVCALLKALTKSRGLSVCVVIHQPRLDVVALFTRLVVLSRGRPVFCGGVGDDLRAFWRVTFAGTPVPPPNALDVLVDLGATLKRVLYCRFNSREFEPSQRSQEKRIIPRSLRGPLKRDEHPEVGPPRELALKEVSRSQ